MAPADELKTKNLKTKWPHLPRSIRVQQTYITELIVKLQVTIGSGRRDRNCNCAAVVSPPGPACRYLYS